MTCSAIPKIPIGYQYRLRLKSQGAGVMFPAGATYTAQVRSDETGEVLATLTTAGGGFVRVSDTELDVVMTAAQTQAFPVGAVVFDWVRTDGIDQHGGYIVTVPTFRPITRVVE